MKSPNVIWHNSNIVREDRVKLMCHKNKVLWFTGLSGCGKSTIANELSKKLHKKGILTYILDGDNIRHGLNKDLGFSQEDREENIRRIREVTKLFYDAGIFVFVCFISPYKKDRDKVRELIGEDFIEIFVDCPLEECEKRDTKGLYKKAHRGEIKDFTGINAPYEKPEHPEIMVDTKAGDIQESVQKIGNYLEDNSIPKVDIKKIIHIAKQAGKEILKIYEKDFSVEYKEDQSPLTEADLASNKLIEEELKKLYPNISILSEENKKTIYEERKKWKYYWLIDPLDGTKEFVKKNGEFTVNIALMKKNKPLMGVVYVPVRDISYYSDGCNSYKQIKYNLPVKMPVKEKRNHYTIVISRSHCSKETRNFIDEKKKKHGEIKLVSVGSALKLCLVAEGKADIYPRLSPTMEWDTAAAHAIVKSAGKNIYEFKDNREIKYNKEDLQNPWFIVE